MISREPGPNEPRGGGPSADPHPLDSALVAAHFYALNGFATLPTWPGTKRPFIPYKERRDAYTIADESETNGWWGVEPPCGIAVMLGGPGGLIGIDTDSAEAAEVLRIRQPDLPTTWTADSGSPDPARRHHFFRARPDLPAAAKITPWHPQLEFRGWGGLMILPPSLHPSGRHYRWLDRLSPLDVPLAPLPEAIAEEFRRHAARKQAVIRAVGVRPAWAAPPVAQTAAHRLMVNSLPGVDWPTKQFLLGEFCEGPQWNDRLFIAACDLHGCSVDEAWAEEALLLGAAPWNADEEEKALATIASAFSRLRTPAVEQPDLVARLRRRAL